MMPEKIVATNVKTKWWRPAEIVPFTATVAVFSVPLCSGGQKRPLGTVYGVSGWYVPVL